MVKVYKLDRSFRVRRLGFRNGEYVIKVKPYVGRRALIVGFPHSCDFIIDGEKRTAYLEDISIHRDERTGKFLFISVYTSRNTDGWDAVMLRIRTARKELMVTVSKFNKKRITRRLHELASLR